MRTKGFCIFVILASSIGCGRKHASLTMPASPNPFANSIYSAHDYSADLTAYNTASSTEAKRAARNDIVYGLMGSIDDAYGQYTKGLFTGKGAEGVVADTVQLGLTASSTISGVKATKTILSALATAFTGINLSYDKNFFAQQTFSAIGIAMQARRDKARKAIIDKLDKDVVEYPLSAAKRDLVSYFYAGTLPGGLQELQEQAAKASKEADTEASPASLH